MEKQICLFLWKDQQMFDTVNNQQHHNWAAGGVWHICALIFI